MTAPKPDDVVVERRHRELAAVEYYSPTSYRHRQILKWIEKGEPNAGVNDCLVRFALALATVEHNARREAFIDVAAWLDSSGLPGYSDAARHIRCNINDTDAPGDGTCLPLPEPPKEPSR